MMLILITLAGILLMEMVLAPAVLYYGFHPEYRNRRVVLLWIVLALMGWGFVYFAMRVLL